jgi:uncharacterized membrane protein (DUF485 family)
MANAWPGRFLPVHRAWMEIWLVMSYFLFLPLVSYFPSFVSSLAFGRKAGSTRWPCGVARGLLVFALPHIKAQAVQLQTLNSLWCCLTLQPEPRATEKA